MIGSLAHEHATTSAGSWSNTASSPRRDELRVRYQEWATEALTRLTDEANRDIIERYVRWQHLRRMNQMETVPHGTFLRSKQTVTVAINFVNWLHERGVTLEDLQQSDVDAWVAGGPTTRLIADRFLNWAIKNRLARSGLTIPKHRRGTSKKLSAPTKRPRSPKSSTAAT